MMPAPTPADVATQSSSHRGLGLLRVVVAALLCTHGTYRAVHAGYVAGFGEFLSGSGVPAGGLVAWAITAWEIGGGLWLASGRAVRVAAAIFVGELAMGIVMVHRHDGWFVVGGGRNGMEYSVLLITCLLALILDERRRRAAA